jgi:hypothetical protein
MRCEPELFDLRIFDSRSSLLKDLAPGLTKVGASGFGRISQISFQTLPDDSIEPFRITEIYLLWVRAIEVDIAGYLNTPANGRIAATQSNLAFVEG